MQNANPECGFAVENPCKEVVLHTLLDYLDFSLFRMHLQGVNTSERMEGVTPTLPVQKRGHFAGKLHPLCISIVYYIDSRIHSYHSKMKKTNEDTNSLYYIGKVTFLEI